MPTVRSHADYELCLVAILRELGGRASPGQVKREFERRYSSSIPRDHEDRWPSQLEGAQRRLQRRKQVFAPDPVLWELA
jgi:hypothetical protein